MAASQQTNITNDIGGKRHDLEPDECTPLLKRPDDIRGKGYLVALSGAAVRADEEEGRCEIPLTDKPPRGPAPRNPVGVISILLLGAYLVFLQLKSIFPRSSNSLCITHLVASIGAGILSTFNPRFRISSSVRRLIGAYPQVFSSQTQILLLFWLRAALSAASFMTLVMRDGLSRRTCWPCAPRNLW
jgi:hypothetical protein